MGGVTGNVYCGCGALGTLNGLWYRGACACTTPGSASRPSPHTTANCEILKVIVSRILVNIRPWLLDSTLAWDGIRTQF